MQSHIHTNLHVRCLYVCILVCRCNNFPDELGGTISVAEQGLDENESSGTAVTLHITHNRKKIWLVLDLEHQEGNFDWGACCMSLGWRLRQKKKDAKPGLLTDPPLDMEMGNIQRTSISRRALFSWSASANALPPSGPTSLPVRSEVLPGLEEVVRSAFWARAANGHMGGEGVPGNGLGHSCA